MFGPECFIHAANRLGAVLGSIPIITYDLIGFEGHTIFILPTSYMDKEGLLKDKDIYADLAEIIAGQKKGRESDEEFIYFNSVGLSYIDLNFAHEIYREASLLGLGRDIVLAESDRVDYRCFI